MAFKGRKALPPETSGDMHDAFSKWRKVLTSFGRAGKVKRIKKRFNRLARRLAKKETTPL